MSALAGETVLTATAQAGAELGDTVETAAVTVLLVRVAADLAEYMVLPAVVAVVAVEVSVFMGREQAVPHNLSRATVALAEAAAAMGQSIMLRLAAMAVSTVGQPVVVAGLEELRAKVRAALSGLEVCVYFRQR
jgi:hypothetical protein